MMKFFRLLVVVMTWCLLLSEARAVHPDIFFSPNRGQWHSNISYQIKMNPGFMYLERKGITFLFLEAEGHHDGDQQHVHEGPERAHALKIDFPGASDEVRFAEGKHVSFYENYFLGNDPAKWQSQLYPAMEVEQKNVYPGIELRYYGTEQGELKYDYVLAPQADYTLIRRVYSGADQLFLKQGELHIVTSIGTVIEKRPKAFQLINGKQKEIPCEFALRGTEVTFVFPKGYDRSKELIIDPVLVFSTFSGSTADNFGFTATYDNQKNSFGGGIIFPTGQYPVTAGAFQSGFSGTPSIGNTTRDIGITKFNVNGNNLIYSTYIGGTGTEAPHSIVCNNAGELYVMGTTSSSNFPMAGTPYDNSFAGGGAATPPSSGMDYAAGSDIFVLRLNPAGTALLASTYVGGTGNDGLNLSTALAYSYGDVFRGEIIVESTGNVVIASVTGSANFPVTGNAPEPLFGGGNYDAVVFRLSANLSALMWSTYLGGSNADAAYGVQEDDNGDIYVSGGTQSFDLIVTPGVINPGFIAGVDGFVCRYSANGNSILAATYLGTLNYDQAYFVQIDSDGDVYVLGQTTGTYPISPGVYNNNNSGQFLHKMNNTFTTTLWSTRIGRNTGNVDFSPSAFLVNNCKQIYIAGWGGTLAGLAPYQALGSSTVGLPITSDAIQSSTDGNDFYLMILAPDAQSLLFGTYFGAPSPSNEHVDGGTSRFDKDGVVYQAVCGGCGGQSNFPTTPGAWSNTNNSPNCNLVVFKIDLKEIVAQAQFNFVGDRCNPPVGIQFDNTSTGAISYEWNFGDGTTSTLENPSHTFAAPGTYQVTLIALDSNTCNGVDTALLNVFIPGPLSVAVSPGDTICNGESTVAQVIGGATYTWTPSTGVSGGNTATPTLSPQVSTTYTVIAIDTNGCADTQTVHVHVQQFVNAGLNAVFTPCSIPVQVSFINESANAVQYFWDFGNGMTSVQPDAQITYTNPGYYDITIVAVDPSTCDGSDTASMQIYLPPPAEITVTGTDTICSNQEAQLFVSGAESYTWFPPFDINDPTLPNPWVGPDFTTTYGVIGIDTNGCADTGYVTVNVFPPTSIDAGSNIILDIGDAPVLNPSLPSSGTFFWSPSTGLSCTDCQNPVATPDFNQWYYLTYTDLYGCTYVDSLQVLVTPSVFIPNAFSPNDDAHNNVFYPIVRNLATYEFWIFNRWGEVIFHTTDQNEGWNGRHKNNVMCPNDVYVWKIKYTDYIQPDEERVKIGHVTLVK